MIPLYNLDGKSTCPLGLEMCQNRLAVPTWSYAMEVAPPTQIIELGTYSGGLTIALGVHAYLIGCKITSYERSRAPKQQYTALGQLLGVTFRDEVDLWTCEAEIAELIRRPGRVYVLCDGGDKQRELTTFAQYLKPDDVIAAHDYNHMAEFTQNLELMSWPFCEITPAQAAPAVAAHDLEPWMQSYFDHAGWLVYRKRA